MVTASAVSSMICTTSRRYETFTTREAPSIST